MTCKGPIGALFAHPQRREARFRAYGIRRGPRAKHRQARSGWDSLTPTETKITALVEGGLSVRRCLTALAGGRA